MPAEPKCPDTCPEQPVCGNFAAAFHRAVREHEGGTEAGVPAGEVDWIKLSTRYLTCKKCPCAYKNVMETVFLLQDSRGASEKIAANLSRRINRESVEAFRSWG